MSGGTELFVLVVGVDVAIGPLITLVIFDRNKTFTALRRDIFVVAILQLTALGYGLHAVSISRPVVLALEEDRFRIVAAMDVYIKELPSAASGLGALSFTGPRIVRSPLPTDPKQKSDALDLALKGFDIGTRPLLWTHWDDAARKQALTHAKPLSVLIRKYEGHQSEFKVAVAKTGKPAETLVYIPTITFRGDWVTLLDSLTGDVVGFAPFDGF